MLRLMIEDRAHRMRAPYKNYQFIISILCGLSFSGFQRLQSSGGKKMPRCQCRRTLISISNGVSFAIEFIMCCAHRKEAEAEGKRVATTERKKLSCPSSFSNGDSRPMFFETAKKDRS